MPRLALIILATCTLAIPPAAAQTSAAQAEAAFDRGQELQHQNRIAEACAAFEESMTLDPQCGTQYNLALCYLELARTASAWVHFHELSAKDPYEKRRADAERRSNDLLPRLTNIALKLSVPTPGLVVTRDGLDITRLANTVVPIDPGTYHFVASAPGHHDWSAVVAVTGADAGQTIDVVVPALEPIPAPAPLRVAELQPSPLHLTGLPLSERPSPSAGSARRRAGHGIIIAGLLGLGAGLTLGYLDAPPQAATITVAASGAVTMAGTVLYLTAPRGVAAAPLAGPGTVGVTVASRF